MSKVLNDSLSLFLVSTFLFFCSFAAVAEELPLSLGRHLSAQGNYDAAITEYKRFLFFHPDDSRVGEVYYNIGLAYKAQGLWTEAVTALRTAIYLAINNETKSEYQLALAVTLIATKNYDLAQLELIKVVLRKPSLPLFRRALSCKRLPIFTNFDGKRRVASYRIIPLMKGLMFFEAALNMPQKSIKVAKVLSTILPGAGHVYTGDWRDGALLLNGVLGFLAIDAVLDEHYTDAALWGGFIFLRYYRGNTFRAGAAALRLLKHFCNGSKRFLIFGMPQRTSYQSSRTVLACRIRAIKKATILPGAGHVYTGDWRDGL